MTATTSINLSGELLKVYSPYAIALAKNHGMTVGPIAIVTNGNGKKVKQPLTDHGHQSFSSVPNEVGLLFLAASKRIPFDAIAVGVGFYPGPSSVIVLDVDVKDDGSGPDDLAELKKSFGSFTDDAPEMITASGGSHYYLSRPKGAEHIGNTKLAPGIDVRCDAGWVVFAAPGYEWDAGYKGFWCRDFHPKCAEPVCEDQNCTNKPCPVDHPMVAF